MTRLEVCVDNPAGLEAACAGGADRIELCSALGVGGLTPSAGMMARAGRCGVPVVALIRPRDGGFVYSAAEEDVMVSDIRQAADAGLAGVAIGALTPAGELDRPLLERLIRHAGRLELTLHRAFDLTRSPAAALEAAIELGFHRVLTSGGAPQAMAGAPHLAALVRQSRGRLNIMAGSGIHPGNVAALLAATQVDEIHASCRGPAPEADATWAEFGFSGPAMGSTSTAVVSALKRQLANWAATPGR